MASRARVPVAFRLSKRGHRSHIWPGRDRRSGSTMWCRCIFRNSTRPASPCADASLANLPCSRITVTCTAPGALQPFVDSRGEVAEQHGRHPGGSDRQYSGLCMDHSSLLRDIGPNCAPSFARGRLLLPRRAAVRRSPASTGRPGAARHLAWQARFAARRVWRCFSTPCPDP